MRHNIEQTYHIWGKKKANYDECYWTKKCEVSWNLSTIISLLNNRRIFEERKKLHQIMSLTFRWLRGSQLAGFKHFLIHECLLWIFKRSFSFGKLPKLVETFDSEKNFFEINKPLCLGAFEEANDTKDALYYQISTPFLKAAFELLRNFSSFQCSFS